jgi:hypothetical protein
MIGGRGALRWGARIRAAGRLGLVPIACAAIVLCIVAPASARTEGYWPFPRFVTLRTLVRHVEVRTGPYTTWRSAGYTGDVGTKVYINCYSLGTRIAGNAVWYHIFRPLRGFVTAYALNSHSDPVAGVVRCKADRFSRTYHALVGGLPIRSGPSAATSTRAMLGRAGSPVRIVCFSYGQKLFGDSVWYRTTSPVSGWVPGLYLDTGHDPAFGVPPC